MRVCVLRPDARSWVLICLETLLYPQNLLTTLHCHSVHCNCKVYKFSLNISFFLLFLWFINISSVFPFFIILFLVQKKFNWLTWIMVSVSIYSHLPNIIINHSHRSCWLDFQVHQMNCSYVSSSTCIHHILILFYSFFLSSSILNLVALFWEHFTASLHCLQKLSLYPL